ncbi:unnamed protein product [Amoebophrya sp. A25]|nr:unnamed protein product [Amoebophrya sp. A25]|eukprot:GSA25T00001271001.1
MIVEEAGMGIGVRTSWSPKQQELNATKLKEQQKPLHSRSSTSQIINTKNFQDNSHQRISYLLRAHRPL